MPVYLLHGFRWYREGFTGIRTHGVIHNLDGFSSNYIQNEGSKHAFLSSFRELFPTIMDGLEDKKTGRSLEFIEPYDPEDEHSENAISTKFAFVADRVITMAAGSTPSTDKGVVQEDLSPVLPTHPASKGPPNTSSSSNPTVLTNSRPGTSPAYSSPLPRRNSAALSMNVEEVMASGPAVTPQAWEALADLRDKIAEGEKIGWWIVYNGDPERAFGLDEDEYDDEEEISEDAGTRTPTQAGKFSDFDFLNQPMPSLLPPELKDAKYEDEKERILLPQTSSRSPPSAATGEPKPTQDGKSEHHNRRNKSFSLTSMKKSSKVILPAPKDDYVPEPSTLKEINKKEGFRHKFFGRRG